MIRIGLISSSFSGFSPQDVLKFAAETGFEGVEWAAETHLLPGDKAAAQALMMDTLLARLAIVSYAALYRVCPGQESGLGFQSLLDTATILQSPIIRIYAGRSASGKDHEGRERLLEELRRLGDLAAARGITICLSFARGTALEEYASARSLLSELGHPFLRLAWEALPGAKSEEASATIGEFAASTSLLIARKTDSQGRGAPLSKEAEVWGRRVEAFRSGETEPKMSRFVLLGRVGEGDEERLRVDADFLRGLVKPNNPPHC
jgi:hypothetical protein